MALAQLHRSLETSGPFSSRAQTLVDGLTLAAAAGVSAAAPPAVSEPMACSVLEHPCGNRGMPRSAPTALDAAVLFAHDRGVSSTGGRLAVFAPLKNLCPLTPWPATRQDLGGYCERTQLSLAEWLLEAHCDLLRYHGCS